MLSPICVRSLVARSIAKAPSGVTAKAVSALRSSALTPMSTPNMSVSWAIPVASTLSVSEPRSLTMMSRWSAHTMVEPFTRGAFRYMGLETGSVPSFTSGTATSEVGLDSRLTSTPVRTVDAASVKSCAVAPVDLLPENLPKYPGALAATRYVPASPGASR